LFGGTDAATSNAGGTFDLAARIEKSLRGDRTALKSVANLSPAREATLRRANNIVDMTESGKQALLAGQVADHFKKVKFSSGPVGEMLAEAGKRIANGEKAATVYTDVYSKIRDAVDADLGSVGAR
jgi:hypothetical protein